MTAQRSLFRGIAAAIGLVSLVAGAHAAEIYSTFGSGNSFNSGASWTVSGTTSDVGTAYSIATSFSVSQNYNLTSVDFAAFRSTGANSFLFSIVRNNAGAPTGSLVFSTGTPINPGTQSFSATGSLLAGNTYWLILQPNNTNTAGGWYYSNTVATGASVQTNGGSWVSQSGSAPAFRVNGNLAPAALTPEVPAGVQAVPVLLAVGGMALYQRKKKRA